MPARLTAPVLSVDAGLLEKIDTQNAENLFTLWTVFSKCSSALDQGRRLENISWRVWTRETLCCQPHPDAQPRASSTHVDAGATSTAVPSLTGSFESLAEEDMLEYDCATATTTPRDIRPRIRRPSSVHSRSRGREKHITPDDLSKMVMTIKEEKDLEPLTINIVHVPTVELPMEEKSSTRNTAGGSIHAEKALPTTDHSTCDTTSSPRDAHPSIEIPSSHGTAIPTVKSTTSIVRGFSPAQPSSSYRSIPRDPTPANLPAADLAADSTAPTKPAVSKKAPKFAIGVSSGEESFGEKSLADLREPKPTPKKKALFSVGASSNEDELSLPRRMTSRSALSDSLNAPAPTTKKPASFKSTVAARTIPEDQALSDDVFETDEDELDESAIDEDDSSDWEDSNEESGAASPEPKVFTFHRVESRPNLTSRRSMITTLLHQSERAAQLANAASKSTPAIQCLPRSRQTSPPHGPSTAASPADSEHEAPLEMKHPGHRPMRTIAENDGPSAAVAAAAAKSQARAIVVPPSTTNSHFALSPRTTRRNMLAHELTMSLRHHLLWERKQKSQFQRRHTASSDLKDLKQYPERERDRVAMPYMPPIEDPTTTTNNRYFESGIGEYNVEGW